MRCSACGEIWHQLPDAEELNATLDDIADEAKPPVQDVPESIQPIPEGSSVPAIKEDYDAKKSGGVIGGIIAGAAFFGAVTGALIFAQPYIVNALPQSASLYKAIGIDVKLPGYGIVFDKLNAAVKDNGHGGSVIEITGNMINLTSENQYVPMIRGAYLDVMGDEIAHFYIEPPVSKIEAEAQSEFSAVMDHAYPDAQRVVLSFALSVRDSEDGATAEIAHEGGQHVEEHAAPAHGDLHDAETHSEEANHDDGHAEDAHGQAHH